MIVFQYDLNNYDFADCAKMANFIHEKLDKYLETTGEAFFAIPTTCSLAKMDLDELKEIYKMIGNAIERLEER